MCVYAARADSNQKCGPLLLAVPLSALLPKADKNAFVPACGFLKATIIMYNVHTRICACACVFVCVYTFSVLYVYFKRIVGNNNS